MTSLRTSVLVPIFTIIIGLFFYVQFPIMSTTAVFPTKQWADGPCPLITTPMYESKKNDTFTIGASHMATLHNAIFRGYNSIYHQAPHVKPEDYVDFTGYCLSWYKLVKSHHDSEEAELFPKVEEVLGKKDIWGKTHEEHEAFLPGLAKYHTYLTTLSAPSSFSPAKLLAIMAEFQEPFNHHFHSEISTIASLASFGDFPAANTVFAAWGKNSIMKAGMTDVVPFLLLNLDCTYENGLWATWPPMPGPIKWGLTRIGGAWHWGWWKFASCDADGKPRALYALSEASI